jgi:alkanesulfonate monooxygenase SsuD/methylene tetrahydromethanopterin reductase-like flavin-dependent oxidoreductase (luciferase family)
VAATTSEAADDYLPGFARAISDIGKERGWRPTTRADLEAQSGPEGALVVGDPEAVVEKLVRHSEALGGISRFTFQMNAASLPHDKMMRSIELIGARVAPALRESLGATRP